LIVAVNVSPDDSEAVASVIVSTCLTAAVANAANSALEVAPKERLG